MGSDTTQPPTLDYAVKIVSAYVSHNSMQGSELPVLIQQVHKTLSGLGSESAQVAEKPKPAVPVRKSVFPDYIVCLEDGRKLKMLKRHLLTSYNLTPEACRERWGLPPSYPMVAPSYGERRSNLAKAAGLGHKPAAQPNGPMLADAKPAGRSRKLALDKKAE